MNKLMLIISKKLIGEDISDDLKNLHERDILDGIFEMHDLHVNLLQDIRDIAISTENDDVAELVSTLSIISSGPSKLCSIISLYNAPVSVGLNIMKGLADVIETYVSSMDKLYGDKLGGSIQ